MKEDNDEETPEQREKKLKDSVNVRFGGAELSEIKIESANDPIKPFVYSYKVRVPGYAERTGKRLFLQPAFFQKGVGSYVPDQRAPSTTSTSITPGRKKITW